MVIAHWTSTKWYYLSVTNLLSLSQVTVSHELPSTFPWTYTLSNLLVKKTHPRSCPKVLEKNTKPLFQIDLKQLTKTGQFSDVEPLRSWCSQATNEYMHTIHQLIDLGELCSCRVLVETTTVTIQDMKLNIYLKSLELFGVNQSNLWNLWWSLHVWVVKSMVLNISSYVIPPENKWESPSWRCQYLGNLDGWMTLLHWHPALDAFLAWASVNGDPNMAHFKQMTTKCKSLEI